MALRVERFLTAVNASNCYVCWCNETKKGAVVDPAELSPGMDQTVEESGIDLEAIFITHDHYDHTGALDDFRKAFEVKVYGAGRYVDGVVVKDGDNLTLGNVIFRIAAVPGHTDDSLCFITEGAAFVGDALFAAALGGTANRTFFELEAAGVRDKILSLPGDTVIYPGHGPATTVWIECLYNPFFI